MAHWNFSNTWSLIRIDGNVPILDNAIADDFRLISILETLTYIIERGGKCIILTHLGRPQGYDESLSTASLVSWFKKQGFKTAFADTVERIQALRKSEYNCIVFENIRFFETQSTAKKLFESLSLCASYYVFDGWGVAHRNDLSINVLPSYFPQEKKSIGFCVERELKQLQPFKESSQYMMILGGGKGEEKLRLVSRVPNLKRLFLLPAVSTLPVIMENNCVIMKCKNLEELLAQSFELLEPALPLIINGVTAYGDTLNFDTLIKLLQKRTGKTLICGGDTVAALRISLHNATFSTGGGSTLSFLAGDSLPALEAISHD